MSHPAHPTVLAVRDALVATRFLWSTERELHDGIAAALEQHGCEVAREVRVNGRGRLDLLVDGCVAIEVKIDGSWREVRRQLQRYAEMDCVDAVVLATSRPSHRRIDAELAGKPVLVQLVGVAL